MIELNNNLKADILQLGHHGSNTSSAVEFLKTVKPSVAIYSADKNNSYGHPHPNTIQRVKKQVKKYIVFRNWNKQRIKVARIHERITNARTDYLQKISTYIIKNHDIIGIEDLQVSNMLKNNKLAKAISEVS